VPLLAALATLAFLAYGNAKDGAPAHHPERAVLAITFLLALFAADVLVAQLARRTAVAVGSVVFAAWIVAERPIFGAPPGSNPWEDRRAQIERGRALAGARSVVVIPCQYEHFALLAAYGAPERATIRAGTGAEVTPSCPSIEGVER